jgi:hypothetical protein
MKNTEITSLEIPGFPGKNIALLPEVVAILKAGDDELLDVLIECIQPSVFEPMLRASGRFSKTFFANYHKNLQRHGYEAA